MTAQHGLLCEHAPNYDPFAKHLKKLSPMLFGPDAGFNATPPISAIMTSKLQVERFIGWRHYSKYFWYLMRAALHRRCGIDLGDASGRICLAVDVLGTSRYPATSAIRCGSKSTANKK